jgi:hypothetical protein
MVDAPQAYITKDTRGIDLSALTICNSLVVFAKAREVSIQPRSQCLGALDDCRGVLIQRRGSGALLSVACTLLLAIRFEPFMESDIALRSMPVER